MPLYSPRNLERLINLGFVATAKRMLCSFQDFHKNRLPDIEQNGLVKHFYGDKDYELEVPMPSLEKLIDDKLRVRI